MKNKRMLDLVNTIKIDEIPKRLIRYVKEEILDTIGFSMAGAQEQTGQDRIGRITSSSVLREAGIIGDGAKISAIDAFRVNSYLSHLGDYNRGGYHIPHHPGRLVVNSTLAAGEKLDASIGDVVVATLLTHELIMQALKITWQVVWPENEIGPDAKIIPYLDVAPIACILYGLLSSRMKSDLTTVASVLMGALSILQSGIKKDVRETGEKLVLLDQISTSLDKLEYVKGTWRQCLTRTQGMRPKLKDYFLLHNLLALEKAIHSRLITPELIRQIVLVFPLGLNRILCDNVDEIKPQIATATALYISGAESKQSWHLTTRRDSVMISRIAEKIKFAGDIEGYGESNSKGLPFRAQVHSFYGRIQTGCVICPFLALRELDDDSITELFKSNTVSLIGEKQSSELYEKLKGDDSIPIAELLKLTYPTTWTLAILKKIGLFK